MPILFRVCDDVIHACVFVDVRLVVDDAALHGGADEANFVFVYTLPKLSRQPKQRCEPKSEESES